jgi:type II secretory pathway pseudopilin PulG
MSVIVIMGIIAGLLLVAAKGARVKAQIEAAKADITYIASKIEAYKEKRGELPPNLDPTVDDTTTELEIYKTLTDWGFAVPEKRRVDPWGNPYIIVFQRDYPKVFPISSQLPGPPSSGYEPVILNNADNAKIYESSVLGKPNPFSRIKDRYRVAGPPHVLTADAPKEIHTGDPDPTLVPPNLPFLNQPDAFQIISAGPDGLISRDVDLVVNSHTPDADNLTNW